MINQVADMQAKFYEAALNWANEHLEKPVPAQDAMDLLRRQNALWGDYVRETFLHIPSGDYKKSFMDKMTKYLDARARKLMLALSRGGPRGSE